jgi:hypothetical protein
MLPYIKVALAETRISKDSKYIEIKAKTNRFNPNHLLVKVIDFNLTYLQLHFNQNLNLCTLESGRFRSLKSEVKTSLKFRSMK